MTANAAAPLPTAHSGQTACTASTLRPAGASLSRLTGFSSEPGGCAVGLDGTLLLLAMRNGDCSCFDPATGARAAVANGLAWVNAHDVLDRHRGSHPSAFDFQASHGRIGVYLHELPAQAGRPAARTAAAAGPTVRRSTPNGCYWWRCSRASACARTDEVLREVKLPVRCATMPCFSRADLKRSTSPRRARPAAELAAQLDPVRAGLRRSDDAGFAGQLRGLETGYGLKAPRAAPASRALAPLRISLSRCGAPSRPSAYTGIAVAPEGDQRGGDGRVAARPVGAQQHRRGRGEVGHHAGIGQRAAYWRVTGRSTNTGAAQLTRCSLQNTGFAFAAARSSPWPPRTAQAASTTAPPRRGQRRKRRRTRAPGHPMPACSAQGDEASASTASSAAALVDADLLADHPDQPDHGGEHREGHRHLSAPSTRRPRQRLRHRRPQAGRQIGQRHAQAERGEYRQRLRGGQRDGRAQRRRAINGRAGRGHRHREHAGE